MPHQPSFSATLGVYLGTSQTHASPWLLLGTDSRDAHDGWQVANISTRRAPCAPFLLHTYDARCRDLDPSSPGTWGGAAAPLAVSRRLAATHRARHAPVSVLHVQCRLARTAREGPL